MNSLKTHKCKDCDIQFSTKWNLMHHRQENHEVTEICAFFQKGKCKFMPPKTRSTCLQNQAPQSNERNIIECYICKEKFRTRNGNKHQNVNGKLLVNFVEQNQLTIVNSLPTCKGTTTWSRSRQGQVLSSTIDFFIVCECVKKKSGYGDSY